jgi:hypothetical protein
LLEAAVAAEALVLHLLDQVVMVAVVLVVDQTTQVVLVQQTLAVVEVEEQPIHKTADQAAVVK